MDVRRWGGGGGGGREGHEEASARVPSLSPRLNFACSFKEDMDSLNLALFTREAFLLTFGGLIFGRVHLFYYFFSLVARDAL